MAQPLHNFRSQLSKVLSGSLLKKITGAFSINLAGLFASYLLQLVLARNLDLPTYGDYVFIVALSLMIANISGLGIPLTNVRFIPAYFSKNQWPLIKGIISASYIATIALSLGVSIFGSLVIFLIGNYFELKIGNLLILSFILVPILALTLLQVEIIKALKKAIAALFYFKLVYPSLITAGALTIALVGRELTLAHCVAISFFSLLIVLLIQGIIIYKSLPCRVKVSEPEYEIALWTELAVTLLFSKSFSMILRQQMDILLLRIFAGPEEVAFYNIAFRLATLTNLVLVAANAVSAPQFSTLHAENKKQELQSLVSKEAHLIFWPALLISIGLIISSDFLLGMFGSEFIQAKPLLLILLLGQLANSGAGSVGYLLNMTGNQRSVAFILGLSAIFNLAINLLLIPRYGSIGAATGTSLTMAIWNIWLSIVVIKQLKIRPSILGALLPKGVN